MCGLRMGSVTREGVLAGGQVVYSLQNLAAVGRAVLPEPARPQDVKAPESQKIKGH